MNVGCSGTSFGVNYQLFCFIFQNFRLNPLLSIIIPHILACSYEYSLQRIELNLVTNTSLIQVRLSSFQTSLFPIVIVNPKKVLAKRKGVDFALRSDIYILIF